MAYIQLQLRRGTSAEWSSADPVLAVAELGVETDTNQFKVGDGVTSWSSLPYGGLVGPTGPTGPQPDLSAVSVDVVPTLTETYDIGSSDLRWRDLYLSGDTIHLGEAVLSATDGEIDVSFSGSESTKFLTSSDLGSVDSFADFDSSVSASVPVDGGKLAVYNGSSGVWEAVDDVGLFLSTLTGGIFYRDLSNGVTIKGPRAEDGATQNFDGLTFTKFDGFGPPNVTDASTLVTTGVTNMSNWFWYRSSISDFPSDFDISHYDTSSVTNFYGLFSLSEVPNVDISYWDTSSATIMEGMFEGSNLGATDGFNPDITNWDFSSVTNAFRMFKDTEFNQNIGSWDTSSLETSYYMFYNNASFNQDIGGWDTSSVTDMGSMFQNATSFNQNLNSWDVSNVTSIHSMFKGATSFDQTLDSWDTSNVSVMSSAFEGATNFSFNIFDYWDFSSVTNIENVVTGTQLSSSDIEWSTFVVPTDLTTLNGFFKNETSFNEDVTGWNTSNVTNFEKTFFGCTNFNYNVLDFWDVSNATSIGGILNGTQVFDSIDWSTFVFPPNLNSLDYFFEDATNFNQDISSWYTSDINSMQSTFENASSFNQDLSSWDVSNVEDMKSMFRGASSFNSDVSGWDVGSVERFEFMFENATSFNQDITGWNFGGNIPQEYFDSGFTIKHFGIINGASSFNQDISLWDWTKLSTEIVISNSGLSVTNYDNLLIKLSDLADAGTLSSGNITNGYLEARGLNYTSGGAAETARNNLVNNYFWFIDDGGGV